MTTPAAVTGALLGRLLVGKVKQNTFTQWSLLTPTGRAKKNQQARQCQRKECGRWFQLNGTQKRGIDPGKYCSMRCAYEGMRVKPRACIGCGQEFQRRNRSKNAGKYCSRACAFNHQDEWNVYRQGKTQPPRTKSRKQVLMRAGYKCECCGVALRNDGQHLMDDSPEIDHIVPRAKGGRDEMDNLQALCRRCNQLKSDRDDVMFKSIMNFILINQGDSPKLLREAMA